ncbi:MAG TPA: hypothetical protein PKE63_03670 [Lacibacter sp.]|nr:hypothetical protein [Lacibacter sp.]HMO89418.1 hypothetical protein [Lacibacter sp.]HMP86348.1 hypothetical protein [Lacibacter sp.]
MKSMQVLLLLSLLLPGGLFAQTTIEIFQYNWSGHSVQDGYALTKDGKIYITQRIKIRINDDNSLSGTNVAVFKLDGVSYKRDVVIKGTYYPDKLEIYITEDYEKSAQPLPYGLYWCPGRGTLKVFRHAQKPGRYLLKGTINGYGEGCETVNEMELEGGPSGK